MASWQAHVFSSLFKFTIKRKLKGVRDVALVRKMFSPPPYTIPRDVRVTPTNLAGVPGEWVESGAAKQALLFLHGGGFMACSAESHRPITCYLAQLGFRVFAPNYRLAPEHPFPAALDDAVSVFLAMAADSSQPLTLAGDSAGGGLAISLLLSLRERGVRCFAETICRLPPSCI